MTSVFVGQSMWGFHRSQEPQIHLLSTQLESASNEMDGDHQRLWSVYQLNSRQSYCHGRCLSRQSFCNNLMIQEIQPALSEEFRKLNLELVSQVFLAIWWSRRLLKIRLSRTITRWLNQNIKEKLQKPKYKSFSLDNQGSLFFQDRIVLPNDQELRNLFSKKLMTILFQSILAAQRGISIWSSTIGGWKRYRSIFLQVRCCRRVKAQHQQTYRCPILVVIDRFSKVAHFLPVKETISAISTSFHPQSSGLVERVNKILDICSVHASSFSLPRSPIWILEVDCTILLFMYGVILWVRDGVMTIPTTLIIRSCYDELVD